LRCRGSAAGSGNFSDECCSFGLLVEGVSTVRIRPQFFYGAAVLLSAALALAGQAPVKHADLAAARARVPAAARAMENPFASSSDAILAGRKLFKRHCAECHGADAGGSEKAPNLHAPELREAAHGDLFWMIRNGNLKKGMPSWSRLPDQQIWQLVAYLKTLS
jgi:mono/diheme cytochrome c family protein